MKNLMRRLFLALVSTGCGRAQPDRVLDGVEDPRAMRAVVLAIAPVGTTIAEARRRVELEGFRCEPSTQASFAGQSDSFNYSHCSGSSQRDLFVSRRFQLALVDSAGLLGEVFVTTGLIGP